MLLPLIASLVLKMFANSSSAVVCSGRNVGKDVAGVGFFVTWVRSCKACNALSVDDCAGIVVSCGKNSTVSDILSCWESGK